MAAAPAVPLDAQANAGKDPAWTGYLGTPELAGEAARCFRDLGQPRETHIPAA